MVGFGMTKEAHFQTAVTVSRARRDPWALDVAVDPDLLFAAEQTVEHAAPDSLGHTDAASEAWSLS